MNKKPLRIGTRESQLAVWQASLVKQMLEANGYTAELVYIKSEGDIDLQTPLYAMGVQGVFTRTLDIALINDKIDIAVHSMKDVPIQLPQGISQAAVLERASHKDLLVFKGERENIEEALGIVNGEWIKGNSEWSIGNNSLLTIDHSPMIIATSSIRRKALWLNRFPNHTIENLRGNVNTRLQKVQDSNWNGAIFAAAGLDRINLRPENSIELDWMLPAPAQGAIMVVARSNDEFAIEACQNFNDTNTALCTKIERDFLKTLLGGCSTPISALAIIENGHLIFKGNIVAPDGSAKVEVERIIPVDGSDNIGVEAALELLKNGGQQIADQIRNNGK